MCSRVKGAVFKLMRLSTRKKILENHFCPLLIISLKFGVMIWKHMMMFKGVNVFASKNSHSFLYIMLLIWVIWAVVQSSIRKGGASPIKNIVYLLWYEQIFHCFYACPAHVEFEPCAIINAENRKARLCALCGKALHFALFQNRRRLPAFWLVVRSQEEELPQTTIQSANFTACFNLINLIIRICDPPISRWKASPETCM